MSDKQHHGRNVRSLRLLKGIKQKFFAMKLGVSQQYISKLENQETIPEHRLEAIAAVLNITAKEIQHFDENALPGSGSTAQVTIQEVIEYVKVELARRDTQLEQIRRELEKYKRHLRLP